MGYGCCQRLALCGDTFSFASQATRAAGRRLLLRQSTKLHWVCVARAPGGGRRSGAAGFKSPILSPRSCQPNGANEEALRYEIEELKQKDLALDQEIAQLLSEGYSLEELEKHISLLHEYNDIKDAGQMLLGKLAVIRGVTTKQLYPEYDLELSD
ncbi:DNA repair protein SWI5 homolog [Pelecanus crispus]|uniref:DNA repair protein SWI5 homolog n=1 Tax=Pelecanus crispus TaxID=36300 RepID=UPI003F5CFF34